MAKRLKLSAEEVDFLANHICLPCKLPTGSDNSNVHHELFLNLISTALNSTTSSQSTEMFSKELQELVRMFSQWQDIQSSAKVDPEKIHLNLNHLRPNQSSAFYISSQNACILITLLPEDQDYFAVISAFEVLIPNNEVMSTSNDLSRFYPSFSYYIKTYDVLKSKSLAIQISELTNNVIGDTYSISTKKGSKNSEVRDVYNSKYVTEWLVAALASDSPSSNSPLPVQKKIRDEIILKNSLIPFRRSGMWFCIKTILQIRICDIIGKPCGKVLYKVIMCEVIRKIAENSAELREELQLEIIQKLARRIYKLDLAIKDQKLNSVVSEITMSSLETIKNVRIRLDSGLEKVRKNSRNKPAKLNYSVIDKNDVIHHNLSCVQEITRLVSINQISLDIIDKPPYSPLRHTDSGLPNLDNFKSYKEIDILIYLYDIEWWVREKLDFYVEEHLKCSDLYVALSRFLKKYYEISNSIYSGDPLGYSRMVLVMVHVICKLDRIAANYFELLLEQQLGIDMEFLQYLMLPNSSDLVYAFKLKEYVDKRNKANGPSLIDKNNAAHDSFSAKFYEKYDELKRTKADIEEKANEVCNMKKAEFEEKHKKYCDLMELASQEEHEFIWVDKYRKGYIIGKRNVHSWSCDKCKYEKEANGIKIFIYEWPLPSCEKCVYSKMHIFNTPHSETCLCNLHAKIVLAELKIPNCISCLRDSLHFFTTALFSNMYSSESISGNWTKAEKLKSLANNYQEITTFGSTTKSFENSHYSYFKMTVLSELISCFKPNGWSVRYSTFKNTISYSVNYNKCIEICCFKATCPYDKLQFALKWVDHDENLVISMLSTCPKSLKLSEYLKFVLFRSGSSLQLLNLLDAIETRGLSFYHKSVYSLLSQSLWQVGPLYPVNYNNNLVYPASHFECSNTKYMLQMHKSLKSYLDTISQNWSEHIILINIITIVRRFLSLSPSQEILLLMTELLKDCRKVCLHWKEMIENTILHSSIFNTTQMNLLKSKLLQVCSFAILTFSIDSQYIDLLMNSEEDAVSWLRFMSKMYDMEILYKGGNIGLLNDDMKRIITGCLLSIEKKFKKICEECNGEILNQFSMEKWGAAIQGEFSDWELYPQSFYYKAYFTRKSDNSRIALKIGLDGAFLVQGEPIGKLPKEIEEHSLFTSFFETTNFEVQPGSGGVGTYSTSKIKVSDGLSVNYTFYKKNSDLIILEFKETTDNYEVFQLIPRSLLKNCFPTMFINEYSHWVNKETNILEFRTKTYKNKKYHQEIQFLLDLNTKKLHDFSMKKTLISINSRTFKEITENITQRIELDQHVHIFVSESLIAIELIRYNLTFRLENAKIESHEFRGMIVSENQQLDTLFGLENGLLLCEKEVEKGIPPKKKLIMPHCMLNISSGKIHQNIEVSIENLRSPNFFTFDIDETLRILRAGESIVAWLYLAWLHASTSHILDDPFLLQTGTSRALEILQSGNCWTCKPLPREAVVTLENISKLSPIRSFYPTHLTSMQSIQWPNGIPSLIAHEGYCYIAEKIFKDSQRLSFAFTHESTNSPSSFYSIKTSKLLSCKAYYRNMKFNQRLQEEFENMIDRRNDIIIQKNGDFSKTTEVVNVRKVMSKKFRPQNCVKISKFSGNLKGVTDGFSMTSILNWILVENDFNNKWLDLYVLAQNENYEERQRLYLILSLFAYKGHNLEDLLFLQLVSLFRHVFTIKPPKHSAYNLDSFT